MRPNALSFGGLFAMGFDDTGEYVLVVSHSGRGVFSTRTWEKVARDPTEVYPIEGKVEGIGPIKGKLVSVVQRVIFADEKTEGSVSDDMILRSPDGTYELVGESWGVTFR